jgi:hypothetical protein
MKIKKGLWNLVKGVTAASVIYASSLLPLHAQEPNLERPIKEYTEYVKTYKEAIKDGEIDSYDIESLEFVLAKEVQKVSENIFENGEVKDEFYEDRDKKSYLLRYNDAVNMLNVFRDHIRLRNNWYNSSLTKGDFFHHGSGVCQYWGSDINSIGRTQGSVKYFEWKDKESDRLRVINDMFIYTKIHKDIRLEDPFIKDPEVKLLYQERPVNNKIPYWPGFGLGLLFPLLAAFTGSYVRNKMGRKVNPHHYSEYEEISGIYLVGSFFLGWLAIDSIHPAAYPVRLASSLIVETLLTGFEKLDIEKNEKHRLEWLAKQEKEKLNDELERERLEKEALEKDKLEKEPTKNPFDYDIPVIEEVGK